MNRIKQILSALPFAFAMAALVTGRTDARWLVAVRMAVTDASLISGRRTRRGG